MLSEFFKGGRIELENDFTLAGYRHLLGCAKESGYQFITFDQIDREVQSACLLRHDVDSELWATSAMAQIESEMGISATYFVMTRSTAYNLLCVESKAAIETLLNCGHHVGLHFMCEGLNGSAPEVIEECVLRERDLLEQEFGTKVHSFSFHQPSREVIAKEIVVPGLVNTYHPVQLKQFTYFSDSNMNWRREHPYDVFLCRKYQKVQLLIHPMWWTEEPLRLEEKWRKVLAENRRKLLDHWYARELTLRDVKL